MAELVYLGCNSEYGKLEGLEFMLLNLYCG